MSSSVDFDSVQLLDVSRHFGRRRALSHITCQANRGAILGLLGPNGAGKYTLLAILATLLKPTSGAVRYGSSSIGADGESLRRSIGVLGHDLFLYPELTARENLTFFGQLYGLDDARGRVERALEAAGLTTRADDQVSGFSRGMRQRVALERALLHEPRLILLDEPFTGLDQASTERLVDRLRRCQQAGCLLVVATHDPERLAPLATQRLALV